MGPKVKSIKLSAESKSRDLVPVGPRHLSSKHEGRPGEIRDKPTTSRALVLRNGKYGARGTGEIMATGKISGREKLDLLGEDLLEKRTESAKAAVGTPFRLEKCLRIAHSQFNACMDEILSLQDSESFYTEIVADIQARTLPNQSKEFDPLNDSAYGASIIATRVHNAYMLAAAWKIVRDTLHELDEEGLVDATARAQIRRDDRLKRLYLVLYDIINVLANTYQAKFSVLVTTAPHYVHYFKSAEDSDLDDADKMTFDWAELRKAYRSFLDSIIIELCLPHSLYPRQVLFSILHDAVDESPREAKRFPQAVWDAVGDLSVAVELQEIIESPLLGADFENLRNTPREMPEEYESWVDAQLFSERASKEISALKNSINPLTKTKTRQGLETLWRTINLNYKAVSGKDIDELWQLSDEKERTPQWHSYYMPGLANDFDDPPGGRNAGKKTLLAITDHAANEGDSGDDENLPGLLDVSDSEDSSNAASDTDNDSDEDDEDDDEMDDEEEGYDTDEEERYRDLLREAMDIATTNPDFLDPSHQAAESDLERDRKGNPFLKLLGALKGRMFSSNPTLKTVNRSQPRTPFLGGKPTASASTPAPGSGTSDDDIPPLEPIIAHERPKRATKAAPSQATGSSQTRGVTLEEVQDEDDILREATKKKKKPKHKKKKKPSATTANEQARETSPLPSLSPPVNATTPASPSQTFVSPVSGSSQSPGKKKKKNGSSDSVNTTKSPSSPPRATSVSSTTYPPYMSTTSLTLPLEQSAQSARSYLQSEKLNESKTKTKSRPGHASLFSVPERKGLFSNLGGRNKDNAETRTDKEKKPSLFTKLGRKPKVWLHQLFNTSEDEKKGQAPLKWEHFVKLMEGMGFTYEPSTAGSSVRFDPPNANDPPVTFHKPHPDPTIQPIMLKKFSKKLQQMYGWTEEDFFKDT